MTSAIALLRRLVVVSRGQGRLEGTGEVPLVRLAGPDHFVIAILDHSPRTVHALLESRVDRGIRALAGLSSVGAKLVNTVTVAPRASPIITMIAANEPHYGKLAERQPWDQGS